MFHVFTFVCVKFFREKNKRFAEQGAALVLACSLGLISKDDLIKDGSILE
jgi:hypothetical protein